MSSPSALSLEEWYSEYAPLTESQRLSVSELSAFVSAADNVASPSADAHVAANDERSDDSPDTNMYCWLATKAIEKEVSERADYEPVLEKLRTSMKELDRLMDGVQCARGRMAQLRAGLAFVQDSSAELMSRASTLVHEQTQLEELHEQIMLRLQYFSVLTQATTMLSDEAAVESPDFAMTEHRLCLALQFMQSHPQYKDAQVYQIRIVNGLQRAMSLVKQAFQRHGTGLEANAQKQLQENEVVMDPAKDSLTGMYTAFEGLYERFHSHLETLARLAQMSDDFRNVQCEFDALWVKWRTALVHTCYNRCLAALREAPLEEQLQEAVDIAQKYSAKESQLYVHIFPADSEAVTRIVRHLGEQLQAWLSSRINTNSIETLARLCAIVTNGTDGQWCEPVVHNLSVRLEKTAMMWVKSDVAAFKPVADDLDYPARLKTTTQEDSIASPSTWYPPVRGVHDLLKALHSMSPHNFAVVSLRAIEACESKVHEASTSMRDGKFGGDDGDAADALLFEWKHYVVLRDTLRLAEERLASKAPVASGVSFAMQSVWTIASLATVSDDKAAVDALRAHLEAKIERVIEDLGAFLCASLALPLQIYEKQPLKSPSKAWAAWQTFQQSLDVNLDLIRNKIRMYVQTADMPVLVHTILTPLRATYDTFLESLAELSGNDADDAVAAQHLRTLQHTNELQKQLAQRLSL